MLSEWMHGLGLWETNGRKETILNGNNVNRDLFSDINADGLTGNKKNVQKNIHTG